MSQEDDILVIDGLSKKFGDHQVLNSISMKVKEGAFFGFIGQNGAGKTTTMKNILGLMKPDEGTITVCGKKVTYGQNVTNQYIGYLPDVPEFYPYMTASEYLGLCADITGIAGIEKKNRIEEMLTLVGLADVRHKVGTYSRGMKQRLGIAQALLNHPRLLICDEPTSALDPVGRKEILDILKKSGTTVIFSTHILSDVERICDTVAVLHQGKIVLEGDLQLLKEQNATDTVFIEFANESEKLRWKKANSFNIDNEIDKRIGTDSNVDGTLYSPDQQSKEQKSKERRNKDQQDKEGWIVQETEDSVILHMKADITMRNTLLRMIADQGILIKKFEMQEPTLENIFMEAVQ